MADGALDQWQSLAGVDCQGLKSQIKSARKWEEDGCSAKSLPLAGKSFYLDLSSGKLLKFLTEMVEGFGGVVESFLSKEVSYVISSSREARQESWAPTLSSVVSRDAPIGALPSAGRGPSHKSMGTALISRGKELLHKAIRNQDNTCGNSILDNARLWGVQIRHTDELLSCIRRLESMKHSSKAKVKLLASGLQPRKVAQLKPPFLKIEDESRQLRPLLRQFKNFPEPCFLALRKHSPFESLQVSACSKAPEDQPNSPSLCHVVPQKKRGYCECCQEAFTELLAQQSGKKRRRRGRKRGKDPRGSQFFNAKQTQTQKGHRDPSSTHAVPTGAGAESDYERIMSCPLQNWVLTALLSLLLCHSGFVKADTQPGDLRRWIPNASWRKKWGVPEITYPTRLVGQSSGEEIQKHQLDTRVRKESGSGKGGGEKGGSPVMHLAQVSFLINAFGSAFTLDLELNHHLLSSHYVERHFGQDGNASNTTGAGEHCYYQGGLRGEANSFAALSSCHGLHGVFSDGKATYLLEPHNSPKRREGPLPHLIHWTPVPRTAQGCTKPGCLFAALNSYIPSGLPKLRRRRQVHRGHRTVHSETKFIELIVVNDHQLFEQLRRSVVLTSNFAKSVVNLADVIFKEQLNTRIVLVAMETWASEDKIQVDEDSLETLSEFMKYRQDALPEHSDAVHLFSGHTFRSSRSGTAYVGGICSIGRGGGVNEYGNVGAMAVTLAQTLGQNIGMMWNKHRTSAGDCRCPDSWLGCIMEDTGYYLPRKFSRCSIDEYNQFLAEGGGSCLFNKPLKLLDPPECGNGFVEAGEECDCGSLAECSKGGGNCCKKCTLTHDAMCSDGLCCRGCRYEPRGVTCREAVNECDIPETCTGDSSQCPPNLHKQDGYFCDSEQGRCYGGHCKTRDRQCNALWGRASAERFCYEKLNVEGTERGNCGREGNRWVPCVKQDVLCGYLLCANVSGSPRFGELLGEITTMTFYHQKRYVDCRGGHVQLVDGTDLSYVEDGTPCGPSMLCLDHKCLPVSAFNFSTCPGSWGGQICFDHGVCSNEGQCICYPDWTGKDCSVYDPIPEPKPTGETEKYKGPSGTNIIIGSIAGAILVAAIVLGGTGWGFK